MHRIKRGCPVVNGLFSQEANPQPQISKDVIEKHAVRTVAYSRSGLTRYELRDHRSQQLFRPIGGYFGDFCRSASKSSEAIYVQQAVYLSYTSQRIEFWQGGDSRLHDRFRYTLSGDAWYVERLQP